MTANTLSAPFTPTVYRMLHRAVAATGDADDARAQLMSAEASLRRAVDEGRVLTASSFRFAHYFFIYAECLDGTRTPEVLFGRPEALAAWPDGGSCFAPMLDIFHCGVPWSLEYWSRAQHVEKVEAHVIRLRPEQVASYVFFHYQMQEEQLGSFDKFGLIGMHENLLFFYKEQPFVIEPPLHPGSLNTTNTPDDWHGTMLPHFQPWSDAHGPDDLWRPAETLWSVGLP